jgi:hypothetical protein
MIFNALAKVRIILLVHPVLLVLIIFWYVLLNLQWNNLKKTKTEAFGTAYSFAKTILKFCAIHHLQLANKRSTIMCDHFAVAEVKGLHSGMPNFKAFRLNPKTKRGGLCQEPLVQVLASAYSDCFPGSLIPLGWVERDLKAVMGMFQKAVEYMLGLDLTEFRGFGATFRKNQYLPGSTISPLVGKKKVS